MRFDVLTLFPAMFDGYVGQSLLKLAIESGLVEVHVHDIRDWATKSIRRSTTVPSGAAPAWC